MRQLLDTHDGLAARITAQGIQMPYGPGYIGCYFQVPLRTQVMLMAQLLGAKDPYLAVLYPEALDAILTNTQPDWMESGMGLIEIRGTAPITSYPDNIRDWLMASDEADGLGPDEGDGA